MEFNYLDDVAHAVETAAKMTGAVRGRSIGDVRKAPACPDQRFQRYHKPNGGQWLIEPQTF
jgi:hypothetical protein